VIVDGSDFTFEAYQAGEYGPHVIVHGDCMDVLPKIPDKSVDLVLQKDLTNSTETSIVGHGKQTGIEEKTASREAVVKAKSRNSLALQRSGLVGSPDRSTLRDISNGHGESNEAIGCAIKGTESQGSVERAIQGRHTKHALSTTDREGQMRELWNNGGPVDSPQERGSSGQPPEQPSSALLSMPQPLPQKAVVAKTKIACITDPPYGVNIDTSWLTTLHVKRGKPKNKSDAPVINDDGSLDLSWLGRFGLFCCFGFPHIMILSTRGWLVWDKQPGCDKKGITQPVEMASTNLWKGFDIIRCMWGGYMREAGEQRWGHPTEKPLKVMRFVISKTPDDAIILDPFLGSGTTLVAAKQLGRRGIGIELSLPYCRIAEQRLQQEVLPLSIEPQSKSENQKVAGLSLAFDEQQRDSDCTGQSDSEENVHLAEDRNNESESCDERAD